ncbi:undifferentiated embryonic cell transcription factor 1 [Cynocephalus volans]|uniref:undifferentiated embryonic cell transcription factor 1 n=1 Tax=Cynocephalus volans TaxID=110931 RepID=UPI002FC6186C
MLLRPRRPPPFAPPAPPSPASPGPEPRLAGVAPGTPPGRPSSPGALEEPESPVSPGSAQRTPWSARETELLLGTLLQPAVWRSLLLDRRRALPTYRRVSAALARQQVRRTPAQCRRRYKFLKDKLRDAQGGQPPGPFDAQIRELMGLLGDTGRRRPRRPPGRPQRGRRPAHGAPAPAPHEPGATLLPAAGDPAWTLRFSPSRPKSADAARAPGSPRAPSPAALSTFPPGAGLREDRAPFRDPGSPPALDPVLEEPGSPPGRPEERAPPQAAPLSLNAALLQTLGHLGDIVAILGPLRDQLLTLNQHVEQLRGSFDQTVSLAVGFILGSAAAERGVLGDPRQ